MVVRSNEPFSLPDVAIRWYDLFFVYKDGVDTFSCLYEVYREDTREFIGFEFWPGPDMDCEVFNKYIFVNTLHDFRDLLSDIVDYGFDLVSFGKD